MDDSERPVPVVVVGDGEGVAGTLRDVAGDPDPPLSVTREGDPRSVDPGEYGIAVADGESGDRGAVVAGIRERDPDLPVVALVDDAGDTGAVATLEAGATAVLPRTALSDAPGVAADRIAAMARADPRSAYREVFEGVSDGLVVHDPESGEVLDVNERFCELNGYDREELVGETIGVVTAPGEEYSYERARELITRARDEGPQLFEWRNQRADGSTFPVEVHLSTVSIGGEERVLASVRDVSERKHREREYEQVFNQVNDAITVHDPWAEEMRDANDRLCELVGLDRETVVERGIDGVSATDEGFTAERAYEIQREVAESGEPRTVEWEIEDADGDRRILETKLTPATVGGEPRVLVISRDVTERRRREREYEQIFDGVQDAIAVMDPETLDILDANEAYLDMVGYDDLETVQELGVRGLSATDEGYTFEAGAEIHERVAESGEPEVVEWMAETADGEKRWLEIKVDPATIGGEQVNVAIHRDVTERRRRERKLEVIVERIDEGISLADADREEVVFFSPGWEDLTGLSVAQLQGGESAFFDHVHPEDREDYEAYARRVTADAGDDDPADRHDVEFRFVRPDGDVRWFHLTGYPLEGSEHYGFVSVLSDVTERRRREREYEQIFNGVHDVITIHDTETAEVLEVNDTFCDLLGYDRETILDMGIEAYSAEGFTMDQARRIVREVVETGEPKEMEWAVETADGETRWLDVKGTTVELGGELRFVAIDRDVTERRRREREYEHIFDAVTDAIAVHDPDTGEILEVNETFADLLGYDRERIVELGLDGVSDTDAGFTAERGRAIIDRLNEGETVDPFEWAVLTADGERRWFEVVLTEARIGGERRVLGISRDVTERREREREIAEEREKYSTLVEQSTDGVVVVKDWEFTFVNERFAEIAGRDREDLVGSPFHEVFAPEYRDLVKERYESRVEGESPPSQYDVEVETPAGERHIVELAVSRITHGGEPATLATARDVTERKAREEQLRRTEKQFRQIADAVDEVIHLASPDLSETYYLSPAYEDIWGHAVEEMYEDPLAFEETLHEDDREEFLAFLDRISEVWTDPDREGEDVYSYEYRVRREDDSVRWIDGRVYPIRDEDGEVTRIVSVSRDVTEQKRREQTLESFQEATGELTTADSTADACRTAVSAAVDVFDLGAVAVHLFDEDAGTLSPVAASDAIGSPDDLPAWRAGDRVPWEAFVDETPASVDVDDTPSISVGGEESAVLIPLAGHGLMTVWTDDPEEVVETAHIIAATLEGALNHIVGQRRLEVKRAELVEQTERAEQLERIAELNRRVEAAITGQSDRVGVERAVCDRLVEIDPFVAAWTAEGGTGDGGLTPRTAAGVSADDADRALSAEGGPGGDPHPATRAWRSGEVVVESDLVGATGGWRRDLLRRGVQSVCAIPLSYEGITHGVLVVRATDPSAFDSPGRESIEQLGSSIGYAITAIERRRALESDETIELEFRDDDATVPFARLAAETGCQVRHDRTVRRRDGSISVVYTVIGDVPEDVGEIAGRTLPGETEVVSRDEDEAVVERDGSTWFGSIVSEYGGVLRRGHATPERTTLVIELPTEADTRQFVEGLNETIPSVELFAQRQQRPAETTPGEVSARIEQRLSDRQLEALETAYEMGYFDWPRDHGGQEVADAMEITQPTLNKHLRVAERKVFDLIIGSEAG